MRRALIAVTMILACLAITAAGAQTILARYQIRTIAYSEAGGHRPVSETYPLPSACSQPAGETYTVDGTVTAGQGDPGDVGEPWPSRLSDGTNWIGAANPLWTRLYIVDAAGTGFEALQADDDDRLPVTAHPTGTQTVDGTVTCTPSGTQTVDGTVNVNLQDGAETAITSRTDGGRQDLHVHDTETAAAIAGLRQECELNPDPTTHIRRTTNGAFDIDPGEYGCFAIGETVNFALGDTAAADVGIPYVPGSQQDNCRISVDGAVAVEHSVYRGTTGIFVIVPCL